MRIRLAAAASAAAALLCAAVALAAAEPAAGTRWLPPSPDTVLVELEPARYGADSLLSLRRDLRADTRNEEIAAQFVRTALRQYAVSGDPRLLGYADSALAPWRDDRAPPVDIWLLRGRLLQTRHQFNKAGADLDRLLAVQPESVEALLLAADAWRRGGRTDVARRHCLRLQFAGRPDLAGLCAADILLTLGNNEQAYAAAKRAVAMAGNGSEGEDRVWALSVLAESAGAAGHAEQGREAYEQALAMAKPAPLALTVAYVDLLLAHGDTQAAATMLADLPPAEAVLLRRAMAAAQSRKVNFPNAGEELEQSFAAADIVGTAGLHWRERALYALDVKNDATSGLDFAKRNWQTQKGREDAELLIRAANAAGNPAAAAAVKDWRRRQQRNAT